MEQKICCLCKKQMEGEMLRANPLSNQDCCENCFKHKVIPARLRSLKKLENEEN